MEQSITTPAQRTISIEIILTGQSPDWLALLMRWLGRADHPTKKGTKVDFRCTSDRTKDANMSFYRAKMLDGLEVT